MERLESSPDPRAVAIVKYARSCHNQVKRSYAERYGWWRLVGTGEPPHDPDGLSYMGAQAVRIHIDGIME